MRLQCDGNLVFLQRDPATNYLKWQQRKKLNVSGAWGKGDPFRKDEVSIEMLGDGNLVTYYSPTCNRGQYTHCVRSKQAVWSSGTAGAFSHGTGRLEL